MTPESLRLLKMNCQMVCSEASAAVRAFATAHGTEAALDRYCADGEGDYVLNAALRGELHADEAIAIMERENA